MTGAYATRTLSNPAGERVSIEASAHIGAGSFVSVYLADGTLDYSYHIRLAPEAYAAALSPRFPTEVTA